MTNLATNAVIAELVTVWAEFEEYWYSSKNLRYYADGTNDPTFVDFMQWITEQL